MTVYIREYKDVLARDISDGDIVTWIEDGETPEQAIDRAMAGDGRIEKIFEWQSGDDFGLGIDSTNKSWIADGRAYPGQYGIYPLSFEDLCGILIIC